MQNNGDIFLYAMRAGLLMGICYILRDCSTFVFGGVSESLASFFSMLFTILPFIWIYRMTRILRLKDGEPTGVTFGQGYTFSLFSFIFAGLIYSFSIYLYTKLLNPMLVENVATELVKVCGETMSVDEIAKVKDFVSYLSPSNLSYYIIQGFVFIGAFVALFVNLFVAFGVSRSNKKRTSE